MLRVGLTGGVGSGKGEVTRRLADRGAVVIDADDLARDVVRPGTPGLAAVVAEFGPDVLTPDGELDRQRLAGIVFADPAARQRLEAIVHPLVRAETARLLADAERADPDAVVVNAVPLLVEAGLAGGYDVVVVVAATPEQQLDRLVHQRGMPEADARARIAAQAPLAARLAAADLVVDNSGSLEDLDRAVAQLWRRLQERASRGTARG